MRPRVLVANLVVISLAFACALAQHDVPVSEGQPVTTKEALRQHHVAPTERGLINALRSQEPEVRELAAQALAEDGHKEALPSIEQALLAETVPGNRVNIALSLAQLGDPIGRENLKSTCDNSKEFAYIRMLVAINMGYLGDESCAGAVFDVLQSSSTDDADARKQALSLLPSFKQLGEEDPKKVLDALVKAPSDVSPGVRMTASSMLGRLGNVSAIPFLRSALAKEQNDACRLQMAMDVPRLQKKEEHLQ